MKSRHKREYADLVSQVVRILKTGVVVEGTLSQVEIPYGTRTHLTYKESGKTRTVYVPVSRVEEMSGYVRNWHEVRGLLRQAAAAALAAFREDVKAERESRKAGRRA